jgi:hypothetical protein
VGLSFKFTQQSKTFSTSQFSCSALQQFLANAGSQLSSTGRQLTYGGASLDIIAGAGVLVAPEAAPLEISGEGAGTDMIAVGGAMETLGSGLTGYAQGGTSGALESMTVSLLVNKISSALTKAWFPNVDGATGDNMPALSAEIPGAIQRAEAVCGVSQ